MPRVRRRAILRFVVLLACIACGGVASADDKLTSYQDELSCGEARFRLTTRSLENPANGVHEFASQTLRVINNARGTSALVSLRQRVARPLVLGRRILYDRVTGWACIRSDSGRHYLLLFLSCRPLALDCPADWTAEWNQIIASRGRWVTGDRTGMPDAMVRRLGLVKGLDVAATERDIGPYR